MSPTRRQTPENIGVIVRCMILHNLMIDMNDHTQAIGVDPHLGSNDYKAAHEDKLNHEDGIANVISLRTCYQ